MPTLLVTHTSHYVRAPDGNVHAPPLVARPFWCRYRNVFDRVIVAARVRPVESIPDQWVQSDGDGVGFLDLPDYTGPWAYLLCRNELRKRIEAGIARADAYCLRVPCPIATIVWQALRRRDLSYGVEVVGDPFRALAPGSVRSIARPIARRAFSRDLRRICQEASAVSCVTKHALQELYPSNPKAFTTHYSSIQLPPEAVADSARQRISEKPQFILVGTLEVLYKAQDVLIRAIAKTRRRDIHLTLVGDGRQRPAMEELTASLGIAKQVTFAGHLPAGQAIRNALDAADIFVLPSRQEGLPRAMIEAMARGLPCIGSTVGGIPELLPAEDMVPSGDVGALADKIIEFIDNPQRYAKASRRNLEASKQFLSTVLEPRRTEFYGWLLDMDRATKYHRPGNRIEASQSEAGALGRICLVASIPSTLRVFYSPLIEKLASQRDCELFLVASPGSELDQMGQSFPVTVCGYNITRSINPIKDLGTIIRLVRFFRSKKINLVHSHTPKGGLLGMIAGRIAGVPYRIHTLHGLPSETARGVKRFLLTLSDRVTCSLAHRVCVVSSSLRQRAGDLRICHSHKMLVLCDGTACGVDLVRFNLTEEVVQRALTIRRNHGIPDTTIVIGFVGWLVADKGVTELVDAFTELAQRRSDVHLLMIGAEGGTRDPLPERTLDTIRHHSRISYDGYVERTDCYHAAADLCVLPTRREGFGIALLEAAAMGVPGIATRVTGCVDAIVDGKTGLLVPPNDHRSLLETIERLVDDAATRRAMGIAARERVRSRYSSVRLVEAHIMLYREVMEHTPP